MTDEPVLHQRTTDLRAAVASRDAHSYSAILHMARAANMSSADWSAAHVDGLTDAEVKAYDAFVLDFERRSRALLPRRY